MLYLIATADSLGNAAAPVKVGIAGNPAARLKTLQTGNPRKLILHETWDCHEHAAKLEGDLHELLSNERISGEWFDIAPEMARMWIEANFLILMWSSGMSTAETKQIIAVGERGKRGELRPARIKGYVSLGRTLPKSTFNIASASSSGSAL
jgi:hypothetical protein